MADRGERVALVTGSATGIGRACAVRFAQAGMNVVVNYSRSEADANETVDLVRGCGVRALLVQCNVGSDAAVREMFRNVEREFGRLDVLVNNAGMTYFIDHKNLEELTEEKWDQIFQVNLKGPFFCMRAAVPLLLKTGGGSIVNVSSVAGLTGDGSSIAYSASKGGLNTMTRCFARAFGPQIRVNAVCPGPVDTRWLQAVMTPEQLDKVTSRFPMQRPATPEDIADAVFYLANGTSLTTGQCLMVDGGRTMQ